MQICSRCGGFDVQLYSLRFIVQLPGSRATTIRPDMCSKCVQKIIKYTQEDDT